jgi:hypothetical protein
MFPQSKCPLGKLHFACGTHVYGFRSKSKVDYEDLDKAASSQDMLVCTSSNLNHHQSGDFLCIYSQLFLSRLLSDSKNLQGKSYTTKVAAHRISRIQIFDLHLLWPFCVLRVNWVQRIDLSHHSILLPQIWMPRLWVFTLFGILQSSWDF